MALGEHVSGITWFWADDVLDTGPICEQEPVLLLPGESPGRAYHTRFIPAGVRAFERAVIGCLNGLPRRVVQEDSLASYEHFITQTDDKPPCAMISCSRRREPAASR